MPYWKVGKGYLIMETSVSYIQSIVLERGERIDLLIQEGRYEDAVSICEEIVEWIGQLMN
jgi:hypothetical protein